MGRGLVEKQNAKGAVWSACSDWIPVLSSVPQGSSLGLIPLMICINDVDDRVDCKILKFADDSKLYKRIVTEDDGTEVQEDLAFLFRKSRIW